LSIGLKIFRHVRAEKKKGRTVITHIHTSSYIGFFEKVFFVLLAQWAGSRVVLHIHGGAFNQFFEESSRITQRVISQSLLLPDQLIVLSEWWANFFREQVTPKLDGRVTILHNAVEMPDISIDEAMRARSETQTFRIVFLGSVGDRKGCGELLEAAKQLRDQFKIQFYFLGTGEQKGDLERYRERSRDLRLPNVHFPGYVSGDQKAEQLRQGDLFVLPSRADNFPISLLEAMSYGLPVVVSNVGAMEEVVSEENGIVIPPRDTEALVDAIEFMHLHPERREEMGRNNMRTVTDQYSASQYIESLESIYMSLVNIA
jgi:glycosyltransferase involved in cell wall biosynthesis